MNCYSDGTGKLRFAAGPVLSPIGEAILRRVNTREHTFVYESEGDHVSASEVLDDLIGHVVAAPSAEATAADFEDLDVEHTVAALRKHGLRIGRSLERAITEEASHPVDYLCAVVDDEESNLLAISYEQADHADRMAPGQFGGSATYYSRNVDYVDSTSGALAFAEELDLFIATDDTEEILNLVSRRLAMTLQAIRDPLLRERIAFKLLDGQAFAIVEDAIMNHETEDN